MTRSLFAAMFDEPTRPPVSFTALALKLEFQGVVEHAARPTIAAVAGCLEDSNGASCTRPTIAAVAGRLDDASLEDSCVQAEKGDQDAIDATSASNATSSCRSQSRTFSSVLAEFQKEDQRTTAAVAGRSEDTNITLESGHQPTSTLSTSSSITAEDTSSSITAKSGHQPTIATLADTIVLETGDHASIATLADTVVLENRDPPTFVAVADTIALENRDRPTVAAVADLEDGEQPAAAATYCTLLRLWDAEVPPPSPPRERSPRPRPPLYKRPLYNEAELQAQLARLDRMFNDEFPPYRQRFIYSLLPDDDSEDMDDWYAGCVEAAQAIIDRRERFYFGISGCLELRVQDHVCEYGRTLRVLVLTEDVQKVKRLERRLITRFKGRALCENKINGGGGHVHTSPFFLYLCNRPQ